MVLPDPNIGAGMKFRAPLTDDNVSRPHKLTAETFHAKPLALAVPAVSGASSRLFMCHLLTLSTDLNGIDP